MKMFPRFLNKMSFFSRQAIFKMTDSIYSEELSTPDKLTDKIFHEFDRDQDGVLSFDEFCATASRDPFLVNLLECDPDAHKTDPDVLGIDSTTAE